MADKTAGQQPAQLLANDTNDIAVSRLSALIDGELQEIEHDLLLRSLSRDEAARDRWERYHLISDALQDHLPMMMDVDFAARIRRAIESEPLPQPGVKPLPTWYKPVTGFALAASVVLMALFGLKLTQTDVVQSASEVAAASPTLSTPAALPIQTASSSLQNGRFAVKPVEARLGGYLVDHNGYASMNGMQVMLPYARMVGYQNERER